MSYRPSRPPEYFGSEPGDAARAHAHWLLNFLASKLQVFPEWRGDEELRVRFDELSRSETHARLGFMWVRDDESGSGATRVWNANLGACRNLKPQPAKDTVSTPTTPAMNARRDPLPARCALAHDSMAGVCAAALMDPTGRGAVSMIRPPR